MDDQGAYRTGQAEEPVIDPLSHWVIPAPEPALPRRRIGWLAVGIVVAALVFGAVALAFSGEPVDPNDPGAADVLFIVGPMLAAVAALITGLLLLLVIRLRLVGLSQDRAARALAVGLFGGPAIYLVLLIGGKSALDAANDGRLIQVVGVLPPVVLGAGLTLTVALISYIVRARR